MYQKTQASVCMEIDENPLVSAVPWVWAHTGLHLAQEVAALQRGAGVMTAWVWMRAAGQGSTSSRWGKHLENSFPQSICLLHHCITVLSKAWQ